MTLKNRNNSNIYNLKNKKKYFHLLKIFIFLFLFPFLYFFRIKPLNMDYLTIEFKALVKKYQYLIKTEGNISDESPIWVMWYQGIEKSPPLIKACINSIFVNKGNHPLYIIDKYNLDNYIKLPKYILRKFHKGIFSITHFSDIIRMLLLSKYGGYWIDSTYLVTAPLNYTNSSFFTLKLPYCYPIISKCLWAGNFLAMPKNSFLSTYSYNAFLFYWKNYNSLINYYLIDYIIYIAYENLQELRLLIQKMSYIKCDIFSLNEKLNNSYNESIISCPFNKLKRNGNFISYNDGDLTNYGYIINKYNLLHLNFNSS
jgi:hypothetical protein